MGFTVVNSELINGNLKDSLSTQLKPQATNKGVQHIIQLEIENSKWIIQASSNNEVSYL